MTRHNRTISLDASEMARVREFLAHRWAVWLAFGGQHGADGGEIFETLGGPPEGD